MPHALLVIHRERLCSGVIGTTARDRRNCAPCFIPATSMRTLWALAAAAVQPKALLIADNLCLRQQLVVPRACRGRALRMRTDGSGFWRVGGSAAGETHSSS